MSDKHSAYIGQLTVTSSMPYIVYGSVRGLVSEHRSASAAIRSEHRDNVGCKSQGGYSDANVYCWHTLDGWVQMDEMERRGIRIGCGYERA